MGGIAWFNHFASQATLNVKHGKQLFNIPAQGGLSALMLCCEEGNSEMSELLLNSHTDPNLLQSVCSAMSWNSITAILFGLA